MYPRSLLLASGMLVALAQPGFADTWIKDPDTGCEIWSPEAVGEDAKVTWTGGCPNGKASGLGKLELSQGGNVLGSYDGQMSGGRFHGEGSLKFRETADAKFTEVTASFRDGYPEGVAEVKSADGSVYQGSLDEGKFDGVGLLTDAVGNTYEGQFKDGKPNGHGYYLGKDGEEYYGDYHQGERHGLGLLLNAEAGNYIGEFVDGKASGSGVYEDESGGRYHGQFSNGAPNGAGTYVTVDGKSYQGLFVDGKLDGQVLIAEGGKITSENWKMGRPSE